MSLVSDLQTKLGIVVQNSTLLEQALTHRSYINEHPELEHHNERLEFLGDAVLELVITEHLYHQYPHSEGALTLLRSALVKKDSLAAIAKAIDLGAFILLSKGEEKSGGREKSYLLANTMEAVIGAIYLDQGYSTAQALILRLLLPTLDQIIAENLHIDAKSSLQEKAQGLLGITPAYKVLQESGPAHDRLFVMGAYLGEELIATGQGSSKQQAEQTAARSALAIKQWQ
jgi:ribonuclease-3